MSETTLRYRATTTVAGSFLFWVLTAGAVATAHRYLEARFPGSCLVLSIMAIVLMAFAYMRLVARDATLDQALVIGIGWGVLAILAEVIDITSFTPTYPLLGSPAHEAFRDLMVIAWIGAPALFARRRS